MRNALLFVGLTLSLLACAALYAPLAGLRGTPTPSLPRTAEPTRSPTPSPSATVEPTETPTELPSATPGPVLSPTPTDWFPRGSPAPTARSKLNCRLVWQSPRNEVIFKPGETFGVGWKVTNNGSETWDPDRVVFTYLGGAKLYDFALVHLKASVASGQSVVLAVHMRAPKNPTKYTTYWSLRQGDTFFCILMLSIYVE